MGKMSRASRISVVWFERTNMNPGSTATVVIYSFHTM
jgi:hypothetical protein